VTSQKHVSAMDMPCGNAPLCGFTQLPAWVANIYHGRCINCDLCYGRSFAFSDVLDGESCPVCLLDDGSLKFVTYGCGHRVCASCFSAVKCALPGRLPPNPVDFGCIPLSDDDDECDVILDEWLMVFPMQYRDFNDASNAYGARLVAFNDSKLSLMRRCPICRMDGDPISVSV